MNSSRNRLREGDVLEAKVSDQFAYFQYIGKHAHYGEAILVNSVLHSHRPAVTDDLLAGGYVTFYPVGAAIRHELVEVVGHLKSIGLPRRFRRPGAMSGRHVKTWIIEDEAGEQMKCQLTTDDLQLPIASIWNHEYLIQRIQEGWSPLAQGIES